MTSQGPSPPTAATNVVQTGNAWTNVNSALGSAAFATCVLPLGGNTIGDLISLTGFGFSIPVGSTINGYQVTINGKYTGTPLTGVVIDFSVNLTTDGTTAVGTNKATGGSIGAVANVMTYGGAADLWGNTFTVAQINGANFGVMASYADTDVNSLTANINTVQMTVFYTAAGGTFKASWASGATKIISGAF